MDCFEPKGWVWVRGVQDLVRLQKWGILSVLGGGGRRGRGRQGGGGEGRGGGQGGGNPFPLAERGAPKTLCGCWGEFGSLGLYAGFVFNWVWDLGFRVKGFRAPLVTGT